MPASRIALASLVALLSVAPLAFAAEGAIGSTLPGSAPNTGAVPVTPNLPDAGGNGLFGNLDLTSGLIIGVGVTVAIVAASLFFLGGAKFVNSANVLENDARRTIFEYIQQHPGVHLRAAA